MWIKFVFETVLIIVFGFVGILGNCLLIGLFFKKDTKVNFHKLMIGLAIYDVIYILLSIIMFSVPEIFEDYKTEGYHFYVIPKIIPMLQTALTGSVYFTVCISLERYLIVCHPFYIASKNWSAKRYIIPIVTFSLLYNSIRFFELHTSKHLVPQYNCTRNNLDYYPCYNETLTAEEDGLICLNDSSTSVNNLQSQNQRHINESNHTQRSETLQPMRFQYQVELTTLRKDKYYYTIYIIALNFVFNGILPFTSIITMNILLYKQLKIKVNNHPHLSRSIKRDTLCEVINKELLKRGIDNKRMERSDVMMSKVTITIAFMFVIFHSIKWIPNTYELSQRTMYEEEDIKWPLWVDSVAMVSHFLLVLNSSVNFYIYWITHYKIGSRKPSITIQPLAPKPPQTTHMEMI